MGTIKNIKYQIANSKYLKSFTFIEMIVVVGVIGLALPVLFAIVFVILQQQTKIYRLSQVKREGDYALNVIENIIRNSARSIHNNQPPNDENKICVESESAPGSPLYFQDKYTLGTWSQFYLNGDKIASQSSNPPNVNTNITSNKVKVTTFSISCEGKGLYSSPVVNISFTIQYNTTSTRPEDIVTLNYRTKVKLRSY